MKKFISIIMTIALMISVCTFNAHAQDYALNTLDLNYSGLSIGSISVNGETITLNNVSSDYKYIMLELRDKYGDVKFKGSNKVEAGRVSFEITYYASGENELYVYYSNSEYDNYYPCIISGGIYAYLLPGYGSIVKSSVYDSNLAMQADNNMTDEELNYYLSNFDGLKSDDPEIVGFANNITSFCSNNYEKALVIHDWIANNVYYNWDSCYGYAPRGDQSAKTTFVTHQAVCEGYTNLFVAMARAVGIPARKIMGIGFEDYETECKNISAANHVWAEFYANNRWVVTDVTWDSGNKIENGQWFSSPFPCGRFNFDMAIGGLSIGHKTTVSNIYEKLYLYKDYPEFNQYDNWIPYDYSGTAPMIIQNRLFIPVRAVIEAIGGEVYWEKDGYYDKITCNVNNHNVQMWINYGIFYVDGYEYYFDVPPQIVNGKAMIPLRSIFEHIGCTVEWSDYADEWYGRVALGYLR